MSLRIFLPASLGNISTASRSPSAIGRATTSTNLPRSIMRSRRDPGGPLRNGLKCNGNALLAAHVRLDQGRDGLRSQIQAGNAHGHLPIVQGFVWRARGMSEGNAILVSGYSTASRTDRRRGAARPHRRSGGAGRARRPPPRDCRIVGAGAAGCRDRKFHALG